MRRFLQHGPALLAVASATFLIGCEAVENSEVASQRLLKGHGFHGEGEYVDLAASTVERPFGQASVATTDGMADFLWKNNVRALIVSKGDDVMFESYTGEHDENTLWNVHGISTTMISTAVGAAIKDGKIQSPDEYISLHLPEYGGSALTWRHLLTMTPNIKYRETPFSPVSQTARLFTDDDFSDLVHQPEFNETLKPGEEFQYSSLTAQIMAEALEAVYDAPIERIITNEVWFPMRSELAAKWSVAEEDRQARAGYGLYMTSRDMWRLGRFLATDIKHQVDPEFLAEMQGPVAGRGRFFRRAESRLLSEDWGYGFGTWFVKFPLNGQLVAGYGSIGFGGQTILNVPEYDLTIAVMAQIPPNGGRAAFFQSVLEYALNQEG